MPDELQLLIKPASGDCNQRCVYCFYRRSAAELHPRTETHRMSDATLAGMVRRALRLRRRQTVFCWQGGEPTLMGLEFYRAAVRHMQSSGAGGQSVANTLQTNGLLLDDEWCRFFTQYRFLVGVSLDGPAEIHDHYRKRAGAAGSHADVLRAMNCLRANEAEFNILSVVNDVSARHARRIYGYLRGLGVMHMQFIPCVEAGADGRPAPFSVGPEAYGEFLCELFDAWLPDARAGASERLFEALLLRELTGHTGLCSLDEGCGGYLVVEYDGDVYPCDFFVEDRWRLGNCLTSSFDDLARRGRMRQFRAARAQLPEACGECEWKDLCRGGCLKDRVRLTGRFDAPTWFCRAWKRFLPHAAGPIRELAAWVRANRTAGGTG